MEVFFHDRYEHGLHWACSVMNSTCTQLTASETRTNW